MRQTSELGECLNRTKERVSSTRTKLSAEKKEKLELNKERSEEAISQFLHSSVIEETASVKSNNFDSFCQCSLSTDVLRDTIESERIYPELLRSLDFAFSSLTRTFLARLSTT